MYQWSKVVLFEKSLGGSTLAAGSPLTNVLVSCCVSTNKHLVVGDVEGTMHFINENFTLYKRFQAYQSTIKLVAYNSTENTLITVGNDEDTVSPRVKYWDLNSWDNEGYPSLFNEIALESQMPASALAVSSDLKTTIIGLCDGNISVLSGHPRQSRVGGFRQKDIIVQSGNPITGLYMTKTAEEEVLYVLTLDFVQSYKVTGGNIFKEKDLDNIGADIGCATITSDNRLCLARKEGFFFYTASGKAPAISFECNKKLVAWVKNYVLVVEAEGERKKLTLFDLNEKFIAYQHNMDASHVLNLWGKVVVLTQDGSFFYLTEMDIAQKLAVVTKRHLFEVAINIANSANYSTEQIAEIYLQYGDLLYSKGDFDGAMKQYRATIGCPTISPSSIIKKFLESSQNNNLTQYLEDLHEKGGATANHTTLLFNCYTKRKDFAKISAFLKRQELVFDYGAVIRVCREAGYFDFALQLAKRKKITEWHLKILVEDFKKFEEALSVIRTLDFEQAQLQIKRFGKVLLLELPSETTKFLMELCTDYVPAKTDDAPKDVKEEDDKSIRTKLRANPEDFIRIFTNQPKQQLKFLEYIVANQVGTKPIYNAILDSYLREGTKAGDNQAIVKAKDFLNAQDIPCDVNHALVLSNMHDFQEGTVMIYERKELGTEIAQYYMELNEYDQVVTTCKKYGKTNPKLWNQALLYLSDKGPETEPHLLAVIEQLNSMKSESPIQIVDTLSNSNHQLGCVRSMLIRQLQTQQKECEKDYKIIYQQIEETKKIRQEIVDLQTKGKVFKNHSHLDLPTVHFLSGHSFSVADIPDKNTNPQTRGEFSTLQSRSKTLRSKAMDHSEFFRCLDRSEDPFIEVATYLGRGLFDGKAKKGEAVDELPQLDPGLFADLGLKLI